MARNSGIFGESKSEGNSIFTNEWKNTPQATKVGDLWFCPDSLYYDYFLWDGKIWQAYIRGRKVNVPTRDYVWTPLVGSINLNYPYMTLSNARIADSINYTTSAYAIGAFVHNYSRTRYDYVELFFRNSSDGKVHNFNVMSYADSVGLPQMLAQKLNSGFTWNSDYQKEECRSYWIGTSLIWLKIIDDGSTRYNQFSSDGFNWKTFFSVGRTDFVTANQFGVASSDGILVHYERG